MWDRDLVAETGGRDELALEDGDERGLDEIAEDGTQRVSELFDRACARRCGELRDECAGAHEEGGIVRYGRARRSRAGRTYGTRVKEALHRGTCDERGANRHRDERDEDA